MTSVPIRNVKVGSDFAASASKFEREIRAGRIRDLPRPLLTQQLLGPITLRLLTRTAAPDTPDFPESDTDTVCTVFTDAFIRSAAAAPMAERPCRPGPVTQ